MKQLFLFGLSACCFFNTTIAMPASNKSTTPPPVATPSPRPSPLLFLPSADTDRIPVRYVHDEPSSFYGPLRSRPKHHKYTVYEKKHTKSADDIEIDMLMDQLQKTKTKDD